MLCGLIQKHWKGGAQVKDAVTEAYLQADKTLLTPRSGFLGLGEWWEGRGVAIDVLS